MKRGQMFYVGEIGTKVENESQQNQCMKVQKWNLLFMLNEGKIIANILSIILQASKYFCVLNAWLKQTHCKGD